MTAKPLWTLNGMAQAMGAVRAGVLPVSVNGISIDSRNIGAGDAFFAIKGDNRDGHGPRHQFAPPSPGRGSNLW